MMRSWIRCALLAIVSVSTVLAAANGQGSAQSAWTWSRDFGTVPLPLGGYHLGMTVMDAGLGPELFVCGDFWGSTGYADWVAGWTPATGWRGLGPPYLYDWVEDVEAYDDGAGPALYAGGPFNDFNLKFLARWKPALGWHRVPDTGTFSSGCQLEGGAVLVLAVHDDGTGPGLYAGGYFGAALCMSGNVASNKVIRYDGTGFHSLAGGVDNGIVQSLCSFDDGSGPALYVGGTFTSIGGLPIQGIARWNGLSWSSVGSLALDPALGVEAMVGFDDGSGPALFVSARVAGAYRLARWDGSAWSLIPTPSSSGILPYLAFDDGRGPGLFCWVGFPQLSRSIARWDGHTWTGLGQGLTTLSGAGGSIYDMIAYDVGHGPELFACGHFSRAGDAIPSRNVASWHSAAGPIDLICPGDRTLVPCPCTPGAAQHGCANSFDPSGALMLATGATTNDSLTFTSTGLPPTALCVLFQGDQFISNGAFPWLPGLLPHFGEGLRCAGGNLRRLFTKTAAAGQLVAPELNDPTIRARALGAGDTLAPGAQRFYQLLYRDSSPTFCHPAASFNSTNGVRVVW